MVFEAVIASVPWGKRRCCVCVPNKRILPWILQRGSLWWHVLGMNDVAALKEEMGLLGGSLDFWTLSKNNAAAFLSLSK